MMQAITWQMWRTGAEFGGVPLRFFGFDTSRGPMCETAACVFKSKTGPIRCDFGKGPPYLKTW